LPKSLNKASATKELTIEVVLDIKGLIKEEMVAMEIIQAGTMARWAMVKEVFQIHNNSNKVL
jgi:hypothetical protein